jgi:hypothetical protein
MLPNLYEVQFRWSETKGRTTNWDRRWQEEEPLIRLRRRPRLRAETPGHFGVQARPMTVDECGEDNPPKPCA